MRPCTCDKHHYPPDSPEYCRRCWKWHYDPVYRAFHEKRLTRINQGAAGLGDALLGLVAVGGYRAHHPDIFIDYRVGSACIPFVDLFDGGQNSVSAHDFDNVSDNHFTTPDLQMNIGYNREVKLQGVENRWERYCRNIGAKTAVLPKIKNPARLRQVGSLYRDHVVIAPFSSYKERDYPVQGWLTVEKILMAASYKVVIVHNDAKRCQPFKSPKVISATAEKVAGIILNSLCVLGNDSGIPHLAGVMGQPAIVVCGQTTGRAIFGFYPKVKWLNGHLYCNGCWWQPPYHDSTCSPYCPSSASINPSEIVTAFENTHNWKPTPRKINLTIMVPTMGRRTLFQALKSIKEAGVTPEDEVLVGVDAPVDRWSYIHNIWRYAALPGRLLPIGTGHGDFGHTPRNIMQKQAQGNVLVHLDDDDVFLPGAFAQIRQALSDNYVPHLFAVKSGSKVLNPYFRRACVRTANFVIPNVPDQLGTWGTYRHGDFTFITDTVQKWNGEYVISDHVITDITLRPDPTYHGEEHG